MSTYIGFIGCGNMGGALAKAAAKSEMMTPDHICIADKNTAQAERMAETLGGAVVATNKDVAKYCITYIERTLEEMTKTLLEKYGNLPLVYAGGVMSNTIISRDFRSKFSGRFATAEFSSDNAAGVSILTSITEKRK